MPYASNPYGRWFARVDSMIFSRKFKTRLYNFQIVCFSLLILCFVQIRNELNDRAEPLSTAVM